MRYEIIDGVLLVSPTPSLRHQGAGGGLFHLLAAACPPEFRVLFAPLDWQPGRHRSFQPDLLVVPRASLDEPISTPVLVIEILSPSTARIDRTLKLSAYADSGAGQYWIVDPGSADRDPAIEVYDLVDGAYVLQGRAVGDEEWEISGPVPIRARPNALIS